MPYWTTCCRLKESEGVRGNFVRFVPTSAEPLEEIENHDRNLHILSLLSKEPDAEVTFQGLKRKLGWHQEILSRTLRRLQKDGVLLKTPSGAYKLNAGEEPSFPSRLRRIRDDVTPVTQLWLPQDLDLDDLTSKLKNTWFGGWRWYSHSENGSEKVLTWLSEDASAWVNLRIVDSAMFIEAGPVESLGRDKCIHAGYELLSHIIRRYKSSLAEPKEILQPN